MNIEKFVQEEAKKAIIQLYGAVGEQMLQVSRTRKEFVGDYTLVVFPLLKMSRKSPEQTAQEIGEYMTAHSADVEGFNVIKGFLNLSVAQKIWIQKLNEIVSTEHYGCASASGKTIMVEYSSPNTNKPLHLGHIRNNLLGYSVAEIFKANGHNVIKANLINDRGVHICKSMLAWQKYGNGETPQSAQMKGDHLVGKYYVEFDKIYKAEIRKLIEQGATQEEAEQRAPSIVEAQEMLRKWEANDPQVIELWQTMNGWVYEGFDVTYKSLGVDFDKVYYESKTYLLGKQIVEEGLKKGLLYRKEDGSVWADLTDEGLDEKLLLRADGTSVYMTQDIGTAVQRFEEDRLDSLIYVVGNEQIYHFQVLKIVLEKLGYSWAKAIYHLSYGMVELPEGKMKSREGTVVDADDLVEAMEETAKEMSDELGKLDGMSAQEVGEIGRIVGLGALKYFILKVDPRKTMLFDPRESIDFNGNTGPFIQYTHARIRSIIRRAQSEKVKFSAKVDSSVVLVKEEVELVKHLASLPETIKSAGDNMSPALIGAYTYELARLFNVYYHDHPIMREENELIRDTRLQLSQLVGRVISSNMKLLGIDVPEKM